MSVTTINTRPEGAEDGREMLLVSRHPTEPGRSKFLTVFGVLVKCGEHGCQIRDAKGVVHGYFAWDPGFGFERTWTLCDPTPIRSFPDELGPDVPRWVIDMAETSNHAPYDLWE